MKTLYLSLAMAFAALTAAADITQPADTVISLNNVTKAVITENANGLTLDIDGVSGDENYHQTYSTPYGENVTVTSRQLDTMPLSLWRERQQDDVVVFNGLHFGFVDAVDAPASMPTQMGKSFEIGIENIIAYVRYSADRSWSFSVGCGVDWRNYRMTADTRFVINDGVVSTGDYPEGTEGRFSRIKVFSLGFPILGQHRFNARMIGGERLAIKLGAVLNWNSHGSLLSEWTEVDGTKAKYTTNHIGQRKFSVDILGSVRVAPMTSIYVKYSPMNLFDKGRGPEFTTFSTGLSFLF